MLPELFALDPDRPVLLTMGASVGRNGRNLRADVQLVQTLLNGVDRMSGAATRPLSVDGLVGPMTIAAIERFQRAHTGVVDGRVDPRGTSIRTAVSLLQSSRGLPPSMPGLEPATQNQVASFAGASALVGRGSAVTGGALAVAGSNGFGAPFTATGWVITRTFSVDASFKDKGVYGASLEITNEEDRSVATIKVVAGIVGASKGLPVGFDFSLPSFPSAGGRVFRGLGGFAPITRHSFPGLIGVSMVSANVAGVGVGPGAGITLYQFQWAPAPPGMCTAFAFTAGVQGGLPGIGVASGTGAAVPL